MKGVLHVRQACPQDSGRSLLALRCLKWTSVMCVTVFIVCMHGIAIPFLRPTGPSCDCRIPSKISATQLQRLSRGVLVPMAFAWRNVFFLRANSHLTNPTTTRSHDYKRRNSDALWSNIRLAPMHSGQVEKRPTAQCETRPGTSFTYSLDVSGRQWTEVSGRGGSLVVRV